MGLMADRKRSVEATRTRCYISLSPKVRRNSLTEELEKNCIRQLETSKGQGLKRILNARQKKRRTGWWRGRDRGEIKS